MNLKDVFSDTLPIIQKAAPIVCASLSSPYAKIACAILAAVFNANANDHVETAKKLSDDPDLYAKLSQLEGTHGDFLKSLDYLT